MRPYIPAIAVQCFVNVMNTHSMNVMNTHAQFLHFLEQVDYQIQSPLYSKRIYINHEYNLREDKYSLMKVMLLSLGSNFFVLQQVSKDINAWECDHIFLQLPHIALWTRRCDQTVEITTHSRPPKINPYKFF